MNKRKISVIIPTGENEKVKNINRTIESLLENASTEVEIIILADGWSQKEGIDDRAKISPSKENYGERITVNRGVEEAIGDYVLRIDSHCSMSENWDKILLEQYKEETISLCSLDALDEESWSPLSHKYDFVYIDTSCEEKWWPNYKEDKSLSCEPSMSLTGCGWFCNRQFFLDELKFDESLSKWGCIGPEITVKIEKINSSIILNKNVVCAHVFSTKEGGYPVHEAMMTRVSILKEYSKYLYRAAKRFNAPGWENVDEKYIKEYEELFVYESDVNRKDEVETKDEDGNLIKKIIKIYYPVKYKGVENPDIPEVGQRVTIGAKLKKIKIATLNDHGDFDYETIEDEHEVKKWSFENDL
jgi:glycosyltransferase involved in cell wall biosynthesis